MAHKSLFLSWQVCRINSGSKTMQRSNRMTAAIAVAGCVLLAFVLQSSAAFVLKENTAARAFVSSMMKMTKEDGAENSMQDLISTLAKLDKSWKIQQASKPSSRWTRLSLPSEQDPMSATTMPDGMMSDSLVATMPRGVGDDHVYLLEPPDKTRPSCLIVFVGGAGLGNFPQVAYNEMLLRISNKLNAAVLAAPYTVGLDHFEISKKVGELTRRARIYCQDDPAHNFPHDLPTYVVGHSLGCKLASIYLAATGSPVDGVGFMSFNNFGFSKTIGMAKEFALDITRNMGETSNGGSAFGGANGFNRANFSPDMMNQLFDFAEMTVGMMGVDFTPNPADTERLLELKYDEGLQRKTRLFVFDNDNLDSTPDIWKACQGVKPSVSALPGSHLTPVYFSFDVSDLPAEARGMARESMGGLERVSFGNEHELDVLVAEVCDWVLGKSPSRTPPWTEQPQVEASTT